MAVTPEERNAEGICLSVSDAQAETLRRIRLDEPDAWFDSMMRPDGSRAVVKRGTTFLLFNVDSEGYIVEVDRGFWRRIGSAYDPS
jgi:hypothetical protein